MIGELIKPFCYRNLLKSKTDWKTIVALFYILKIKTVNWKFSHLYVTLARTIIVTSNSIWTAHTACEPITQPQHLASDKEWWGALNDALPFPPCGVKFAISWKPKMLHCWTCRLLRRHGYSIPRGSLKKWWLSKLHFPKRNYTISLLSIQRQRDWRKGNWINNYSECWNF